MVARAMRFPEPPRPQPTGRYLVLFQHDADLSSIKSTIKKATGAKTIDSRDAGGTSSEAINDAVSKGGAFVIERFKIAILDPGDDAGTRMATLQSADEVKQTRPEFFMFTISELHNRYAVWVRDGLQLLAEGIPSTLTSARTIGNDIGLPEPAFADTDEVTWGLAAVGIDRSSFTGRGTRVAILDTGLDFGHPDFVGRAIVSQSFVAGEDAQDVQGHGTHTAGTVAGPKISSIGRRYGVAPDTELFIGKVLNNGGSGREGDIINGMNWAIDQKCTAISMSLGRPTFPGEKPDQLYEDTGAAALQEGSLIIAAAGNESARDFGHIAPVGAPANAPSILSVAAIDPTLKVAPFSCGGLTVGGGEINISAPGVSVYSSFPRPRLSRVLPGTSMACPHVAGLAALWAESDPSLRGKKLWDALERSAREVGSFRDFGRGLAQVPGVGV